MANTGSISPSSKKSFTDDNLHLTTNIRQKEANIQRLNKIQDFQIRVKIFEGRQLDGNNIHPLCCIKCSTHVKFTKTMRSTINPFWNEVFFFNFRCSPIELLEEMIEFKVFNSLKIRHDALIGCFKIDIGSIYEEQNHSLNRKWLLLSDTGDQVTNAKGYLKVSVNVMGPGDEIHVNLLVLPTFSFIIYLLFINDGQNSFDQSIDEDDIEKYGLLERLTQVD